MKRKGQMWDTLIPWMIAIVILFLSLVLYSVFYDKGNSAIEFFRNLVRSR